MKYQKPRGTRDYLPEYMKLWNVILDLWKETMELYNFKEIMTPIFESTDLFIRTAGESSDIVSKEMYTFLDKGNRSITLRPEGTAPVVRAYFENHLDIGLNPTKLYYVQPMFRYERPQLGRFRQHFQYGVECIGVKSPYIDAQIIDMLITFYNKLGIKGPLVLINSLGCSECRSKYRESLLNYLRERSDSLCEQCIVRIEKNPLRVLDCKSEECNKITDVAPKIIDNLCGECDVDFNKVLDLLTKLNINYTVKPNLVRGLDYYNGTVFEIVADGITEKDVIAGGGRYDALFSEIGNKDMSAFGTGAGMERLIRTIEIQNIILPTVERNSLAVGCIDDCALDLSFSIVKKFRSYGYSSELFEGVKAIDKWIKKMSKNGYSHILIIGNNEIEQCCGVVKNLNSFNSKAFKLDVSTITLESIEEALSE